jgi:hypothetical protein
VVIGQWDVMGSCLVGISFLLVKPTFAKRGSFFRERERENKWATRTQSTLTLFTYCKNLILHLLLVMGSELKSASRGKYLSSLNQSYPTTLLCSLTLDRLSQGNRAFWF